MDKFKKITRKILYIELIILIFLSGLYIVRYFLDIYNTKKQSQLLDNIQIDENIVYEENYNIIEELQEIPSIEIVKTERMLKLEELQKENPDIIAWIEIEGTNINYPVLQGEDNDFYMNHNYKKQSISSGSIFLDKDYSWNHTSSNMLIYGHNMKNGTMFRDLLKYKNKSYYDKHPIIKFTTNTYDCNFEIISAFQSKVYKKTDKDVFKYYFYTNISTEEEFNEYAQNVKKASLYDTGKDAVFGDMLITLSTCAYHTNNGRFVVVGKKVSS